MEAPAASTAWRRHAELTEVRRLLTATGSRRFVEELADTHVSTARAILDELGLAADLLAGVTPRPPALADSKEVAA